MALQRTLTVTALVALAGAAAAPHGRAVTYSDLLAPLGSAAPPAAAAPSALYTKYTFDAAQWPMARCLDGGPGAVYVRPSLTPAGATRFKIFFQGGGWCTSHEDCYARSKTDLGSTAGLPATAVDPAGYCGASFLSQDASVNSATADFTSIYVPYCDGTSSTGAALAPAYVNASAAVTYRGAYLRDALVGTLAAAHGLRAATEVLLGGCSAGGLTIYLNVDYLAGLVRAVAPSASVRALADAGWFLDHLNGAGQPFRTPLFEWGFAAWNSSAALAPACLTAYPGEEWKCIFAQYTARFIATPTFLLNSRYDTCQLNVRRGAAPPFPSSASPSLRASPPRAPRTRRWQGCELGLPDANKPWPQMAASSRAAAVAYASDFDAALAASGFASAPQHGGWVSSCLVHCDAGDGAWSHTLAQPRSGSGPALTPSAAFEAWRAGGAGAGDGWWSDRSATPNMTATC